MSEHAQDYTISELMAVFLSRQIKDGDMIGGGSAQLIPRAGQLLAHLSHGPNMRLHFAIRTNLFQQQTLTLSAFESMADWRTARWAESYWVTTEVFDDLRIFRTRFVIIGGIQIDKYGNANLFGVGKDFKKLRFRGPGGIGAPTVGSHVKYYYLFTTSHNRKLFVERCDYITCFGWGSGGKDARRKLSLPGGGPVGCITPLCILDFDDETKQMRLQSVHPGVTVEQVIENTGFDLIIPQVVPETEPPTQEELSILRNRVDPEGLLRKPL